jgi:hypothetical protein
LGGGFSLAPSWPLALDLGRGKAATQPWYKEWQGNLGLPSQALAAAPLLSFFLLDIPQPLRWSPVEISPPYVPHRCAMDPMYLSTYTCWTKKDTSLCCMCASLGGAACCDVGSDRIGSWGKNSTTMSTMFIWTSPLCYLQGYVDLNLFRLLFFISLIRFWFSLVLFVGKKSVSYVAKCFTFNPSHTRAWLAHT